MWKTKMPLLMRPGIWHNLRIRAVADTLRTWLDDHPVTSLQDTVRSSGFVALQVHSVHSLDESGKTVRFINIRLCEII